MWTRCGRKVMTLIFSPKLFIFFKHQCYLLWEALLRWTHVSTFASSTVPLNRYTYIVYGMSVKLFWMFFKFRGDILWRHFQFWEKDKSLGLCFGDKRMNFAKERFVWHGKLSGFAPIILYQSLPNLYKSLVQGLNWRNKFFAVDSGSESSRKQISIIWSLICLFEFSLVEEGRRRRTNLVCYVLRILHID